MKKRKNPLSGEEVLPLTDLGLPEEPALQPDEAAEAVREARRIAGRTAESESSGEPDFPWGPMRPDEKPS
ncbi:MAG TPA: hypothetical protein VMW27_13490 [Thermoanaerobaculia bacterium]|nr:hypothetical protein [Thermoanaerobaculia bacterium]